jgi:hypothetical protein
MLRVIVAMILLATPLAVIGWWASGAIAGFRIWEKLPRKVVKALSLCAVLTLFASGGVVGVASMRGCVTMAGMKAVAEAASRSAAQVTAPSVERVPDHSRSLGKVADPPFEMLTRLRKETAKQERKAAKAKAAEAVNAVISGLITFSHTGIITSMAPLQMTPKSERSGPFCRVTCAAHHGGEYDVETLPELCRANWIPPSAIFVPGWHDFGSSKFEISAPWPGPAQSGFEKYKLYWSDLQSAAKVVHHSESLAGPKT